MSYNDKDDYYKRQAEREAENRRQRDAEERRRREEDDRRNREAEDRRRQEAENRRRQEAEDSHRRDEERRRKDTEYSTRRESEDRKRKEAELKRAEEEAIRSAREAGLNGENFSAGYGYTPIVDVAHSEGKRHRNFINSLFSPSYSPAPLQSNDRVWVPLEGSKGNTELSNLLAVIVLLLIVAFGILYIGVTYGIFLAVLITAGLMWLTHLCFPGIINPNYKKTHYKKTPKYRKAKRAPNAMFSKVMKAKGISEKDNYFEQALYEERETGRKGMAFSGFDKLLTREQNESVKEAYDEELRVLRLEDERRQIHSNFREVGPDVQLFRMEFFEAIKKGFSGKKYTPAVGLSKPQIDELETVNSNAIFLSEGKRDV